MSRLAPQIAQGISEWLWAEIKTSDAPKSPNRYLSQHAEVVERWRQDLGRGTNHYLEKKMAHASRFMPNGSSILSAFLDNPQDPATYPKLLFACLMKLSGENREQAALIATDQPTYLAQRFVWNQITIEEVDSLLTPKALTIEDIQAAAQDKIITPILGLASLDFERGFNGTNFDAETNPVAVKMSNLRNGVLGFCLDVVAYGAQNYTTLSQVPTLEPFSISDDPQIIYPFNLSMWADYTPSNSRYRDTTPGNES